MLRKIERKITPFRIVAREQNGLTPKYIRIVFKISIDFSLYIVVLSVKLVILG